MRLFTGIALPAEIIENLSRLLDHLRPAAHLSWSAPYNLHVTTKFIGDWPDERLGELVDLLRTLPAGQPIDIRLHGLGWFPNPHLPRVLWAGIQAGDGLPRLASATDAALATLGIAAEIRPFSPHLTLARIKDAAPLAKLRQTIAELASVDFGSFTASHFLLYRSTPGPAGSIYTQLAEFALHS
ncbi:MAG TPA: RNA 2',3'-cyclic phosphodiesterase [Bryobacteraceae bacterium]|nr:RNA 2',3'-cyclic phosphodiesterase [Bryobacteraceae bacterium]